MKPSVAFALGVIVGALAFPAGLVVGTLLGGHAALSPPARAR